MLCSKCPVSFMLFDENDLLALYYQYINEFFMLMYRDLLFQIHCSTTKSYYASFPLSQCNWCELMRLGTSVVMETEVSDNYNEN